MPVFVLAVLFISSLNVLSGYFYEFNSSTHCLNFGEILYTVGGGGGVLQYMGNRGGGGGGGGGGGTAIYGQYRCAPV